VNEQPIGVFDSGIGGLTVLKEIFNELPGESTIYLGDTARVPYGIRSGETVVKYSLEMADFLVGKGIKLLVVACNTASAFALAAIKERFHIPVIGVIEPGAKKSVRTTRSGKIGIIGTEGTIRSNSYVNAIKSLYGRSSGSMLIKEHGAKHFDRYFEIRLDGLTVYTKACPLFVPLVEEGWESDDVADLTARHYLEGIKKEPIDTLVLGCTHYPLLKNIIGRVMGNGVALIDSATETVREIRETLMRQGVAPAASSSPSRRFYVTDAEERFRRVGERFLGQTIGHIEKIDVGL
jgi:glutamate racemase